METVLLEIVELLLMQENKIAKQQEAESLQPKTYEYVTAINPTPSGYEHNIRILERVVLVNAPFRADEVIVVISRLGKGENPIYSSRRFYTVKKYWAFFQNFPENRVVTAVGEPVDGYGLLEFYVGGRKFSALAVGKNQELQISEIEEFPPSPLFYLPKSKPKSKVRKK